MTGVSDGDEACQSGLVVVRVEVSEGVRLIRIKIMMTWRRKGECGDGDEETKLNTPSYYSGKSGSPRLFSQGWIEQAFKAFRLMR